MEQIRQQDSIDIRKTQISKDVSVEKPPGWFDDMWHVGMFFLGIIAVLVFVLLIVWQSGGIDGLAQLWLSQTNSESSNVPVAEAKLIYRNTNLGIGFEYSPDYFIEQPELDEVKITINGQVEEEKISVVLLGFGEASSSGEPIFSCSKYIDGCREIDEKVSEYETSGGLRGFVNNIEVATASGSANLQTFSFDLNNSKFSKLFVFPVGENSNQLAQDLTQKMFLIEP